MTGHETMASRGQAAHRPDPKPTSTLEELRIAQAKLKAVEALADHLIDVAEVHRCEPSDTYFAGARDVRQAIACRIHTILDAT